MNQWQFQMFQQQMMQQQQYQMWQQQQQQMWQQFLQSLQQNQQNLQPQNQQSQQGSHEKLPRNKPDEAISLGRGQNIINVTMNANTGHKVVIAANADTTIENLLKIYIKKSGLNLNVIGKDIMFLYHGAQLDYNSHQSIGSMFRNIAVINVYDINGIIAV